MKLVRVWADAEGESHAEVADLPFTEANGMRTVAEPAATVLFFKREAGAFSDWHTVPGRGYVYYLDCSVEIGCSDGTVSVLGPGDVLLEEDTTGRGHTSRVLTDGTCSVVRFREPGA